jgi:tRNA dimethylallyltransferase
MKKKMLVVLGPTSTGKTDVALYLAKKINGELISADSRQVYKYLDLGTGKLPGEYSSLKKGDGFWEIDGIRVRMYDVAEPSLRYNLYRYLGDASAAAEEISSSGKTPILTGGTGLYIRSLTEGLENFGAEEDPGFRGEMEGLAIEEIKERIKKKNPAVLDKLNNSEAGNKRRLIRILEKISSGPVDRKFKGLKEEFDILKIGLKSPMEVLTERIKKRVEKRVSEGMIEEAKRLLGDGRLDAKRMDELGLEYRYMSLFINGEIKSLKEFEEVLSIKIRQFAKRQMTWFKKETNVVWFDITDEKFLEKVELEVYNWYNKPSLLSR